jgi:hypothetical protein
LNDEASAALFSTPIESREQLVPTTSSSKEIFMSANIYLCITAAALLFTVAGCASVQSTSLAADQAVPGLVYRLPKKLIVVTYVVPEDGKPGTATIAASGAVPDMSTRYVANFSRNLIGKNTLEIGIGTSGLLTSSKASTTSQIELILANLAGAAGSLPTLSAMRTSEAAPQCVSKGTYTTTYAFEDLVRDGSSRFCDLTVTAERIPGSTRPTKIAMGSGAQSGYFYRTTVPVMVTVTYSRFARSDERAVVLLPDLDSLEFLPVERSLFANNSAEFTFVDGIPTVYKQDVDGELLALSKLPAAVLKGYFEAIGTAFSQRSTNATNEALLLSKLDALSLQRQRSAQCEKAIASGDAAAILAQCKPG